MKHRQPRSSGRIPKDNEQGGALIFVMVIAAVMLFIAGMTISVAVQTRRSAARRLHGKAAFFCAELALERARPLIAANETSWGTALAAGGFASWLPADDCPGTGGYTYQVTIRDNADDTDQTTDADSTIIVDAQVQQAGVAVASISGVVQTGGTTIMAGYTTQAGQGAQKAGNK